MADEVKGLMSPGGGGLSDDELSSATATESDVISGKTFYSGSDTIRTGSLEEASAYTSATQLVNYANSIYFRFPVNKAYISTGGSGYPEIIASQASMASAAGLSSGMLIPGNTVLGISSSVSSKSAETATVTPGQNQQTYTFSTSSKYCTGNMTVIVPAFTYGKNITVIEAYGSGKGIGQPTTDTKITVSTTGNYRIYVMVMCNGEAATHPTQLVLYVNGVQRYSYTTAEVWNNWYTSLALSAGDYVQIGNLATSSGFDGMMAAALL